MFEKSCRDNSLVVAILYPSFTFLRDSSNVFCTVLAIKSTAIKFLNKNVTSMGNGRW